MGKSQPRVSVPLPARKHPTPGRVAENHRPPRYRLLAAAAALPERLPPEQREDFERTCPMCGQVVMFTVVSGPDATQYLIEDHPCGVATRAGTRADPPAGGHTRL